MLDITHILEDSAVGGTQLTQLTHLTHILEDSAVGGTQLTQLTHLTHILEDSAVGGTQLTQGICRHGQARRLACPWHPSVVCL